MAKDSKHKALANKKARGEHPISEGAKSFDLQRAEKRHAYYKKHGKYPN